MAKKEGGDDEAAAAAAAAAKEKEAEAAAAKAAEEKAAQEAAAKAAQEEKAELEKLRNERKSWEEDRKFREALKPYTRVREDGTIELVQPGTGEETRTEEEVAAERRRQEAADVAAQQSRRYAEFVQRDQEMEAKLRKENPDDPMIEEDLAQARVLIKNCPIEKRDEKAWRSALKMARGENLPKHRERWMNEGRKAAEADIAKNSGLSIRRPVVQKKTDEELVAELTEAQLKEAERKGIDPKVYARRAHELGLGGRK